MALLSKIGPSGVSSTGIYEEKSEIKRMANILNEQFFRNNKYIIYTLPKGFMLIYSGVLLDTPFLKSLTNSTFTPEYSAAISTLNAYLFGCECKT